MLLEQTLSPTTVRLLLIQNRVSGLFLREWNNKTQDSRFLKKIVTRYPCWVSKWQGSETQPVTLLKQKRNNPPCLGGQTEHCFSSVGDNDEGIVPGNGLLLLGKCWGKNKQGLNLLLEAKAKDLSPPSSFRSVIGVLLWRCSELGCPEPQSCKLRELLWNHWLVS